MLLLLCFLLLQCFGLQARSSSSFTHSKKHSENQQRQHRHPSRRAGPGMNWLSQVCLEPNSETFKAVNIYSLKACKASTGFYAAGCAQRSLNFFQNFKDYWEQRASLLAAKSH